MSTFESFIMSDAFFPVLICLLILLVGVFIFVLVYGKKNNRVSRKEIYNKDDINSEDTIKLIKEEAEPLTEVFEITDGEFEKVINEDEENIELPKMIVKEETKVEEDNKVEETPNNLFDTRVILNKDEIEDIKEASGKNIFDDISDFPDFSSIEEQTKKEEHKNTKIEDDIIEAANKYIESIMSGK